MNKIVGATIATAAIAGALIAGYLDYEYCTWKCPKCDTVHKPTFTKWVTGLNLVSRKYLKCPRCGERNWHTRVVLFDDKDFV